MRGEGGGWRRRRQEERSVYYITEIFLETQNVRNSASWALFIIPEIDVNSVTDSGLSAVFSFGC